MDRKQKINCTVTSCLYNDTTRAKCMLEEISVEPCADCNTQEPDESMCGSYEYADTTTTDDDE